MNKNFRLGLCATTALLAVAALAACSKPAGGANGGSAGMAGGFGGPAAAPQLQWTTFTDPVEHAFTIEVPAGWQVQGGVRRLTTADIRSEVTARAPDGSMEIIFGDQSVPGFSTPNAMLNMAGIREGMPYNLGYGNVVMVAQYQAGDSFARTWGAQRLSRSCANPQAIGGRPLPQADQAMDMAYAQGGVRTSIRAGEASFDCTWNGGPGAGYAFAATELIQAQGNALWDAKMLTGFASRADQAPQAAAVLEHVVGSFRIDPGWAARQQGLTAATSRIVAESNDAVRKSIASSFDYKQASHDRAMEHWSQATRGTATFNDPVQGRRELENTEHQWRTRDGRTIGSNSSTPPEPGATELQRAR